MTNSYQRAILIGIMRMVAQNPHIAVKSLEMAPQEATKPGALESYVVTRESTDRTDFNAEEWREVDEYMHVSKMLQLTPQEVAEIVKVGVTLENLLYAFKLVVRTDADTQQRIRFQ